MNIQFNKPCTYQSTVYCTLAVNTECSKLPHNTLFPSQMHMYYPIAFKSNMTSPQDYTWSKKKKRESSTQVEQIFRTKGLTSVDRSNKATLPLTVPRSHSSRLQRIHPRPYDDCNTRTNDFRFPLKPPDPPDLVHEQSSISTLVTCAGPTSSFLARILA